MPRNEALCDACTEQLTAGVLAEPPDEESALSRAVSERILVAMMQAAIDEIERMVADTRAAPRGVNSLHLVRAAWVALQTNIDLHAAAAAAALWRGLSEAAMQCAERASHEDETQPKERTH